MTDPETVDTTPHPVARDRALFEAGDCEPLETFAEDAAANFTAYDDVNPSLIPSDATHVAYYGNGWAANLGKMRAACPSALLSPTLLVPAGSTPYKQFVGWEHGVSIDVEPTLYTPAGAAAEAKRIIAQGVMPKIYFPLSWAGQVVAALNAVGLKRSDVQLHSAHWTGVPHVCSGVTGTAWGVVNMDSTQYTDKALGRSLDANLCRGTYYGPWGKPAPTPKPRPEQKHATGQARAEIIIDWDKPVGRRISVHGTKGTWHAGTEQELELMQVGFWKDGTWKATGVPRRTKPLG